MHGLVGTSHLTKVERKKGELLQERIARERGGDTLISWGGRIEKRDEGRSESANGTMDDGRRGMGKCEHFFYYYFFLGGEI